MYQWFMHVFSHVNVLDHDEKRTWSLLLLHAFHGVPVVDVVTNGHLMFVFFFTFISQVFFWIWSSDYFCIFNLKILRKIDFYLFLILLITFAITIAIFWSNKIDYSVNYCRETGVFFFSLMVIVMKFRAPRVTKTFYELKIINFFGLQVVN